MQKMIAENQTKIIHRIFKLTKKKKKIYEKQTKLIFPRII